MAEPTSRPRAMAVGLIVLTVIAVGLGAFLLIGLLQGDDADINEQNGQVVTILR
jgi:hypothetical protein